MACVCLDEVPGRLQEQHHASEPGLAPAAVAALVCVWCFVTVVLPFRLRSLLVLQASAYGVCLPGRGAWSATRTAPCPESGLAHPAVAAVVLSDCVILLLVSDFRELFHVIGCSF